MVKNKNIKNKAGVFVTKTLKVDHTPYTIVRYYSFYYNLGRLPCLVPRRFSLDKNLRAKEGGKETVPVCTLPMVPRGSSPVARLYLAKDEAPEEVAGAYH